MGPEFQDPEPVGKGGEKKSGERVSIGDGGRTSASECRCWGLAETMCQSVCAHVHIFTITENAKHFLTWSPERVPVVFPTSLSTKMVIRGVP